MSVDTLEKTVSRVEHLVQVVYFFVVVADFVVHYSAVYQQTFSIVGAAQAEILRISLNVIKLVHIDAILFVCNNVK